MSKYSQPSLELSSNDSQGLFAQVEQQLAEGYLEVELTGLSFRRLLPAYSVLLRNAVTHTLGGIRSLLHIDPEPQA